MPLFFCGSSHLGLPSEQKVINFAEDHLMNILLNLVYWGCSIISNFRNKVPIVKKNPLTVLKIYPLEQTVEF
jgi:hypothetical protein